jgi:hypothetical protein
MKKFVFYILVLGFILFGMQACKSDDLCEDTVCNVNEVYLDGVCVDTTCCFCGVYDGLSSGAFETALTGTDTTFTNVPVALNLSRVGFTNECILEYDMSNLLGAMPNTLVISLNGTLLDSTITFPEQDYPFAGLITITFSGELVYFAECDSMRGNIQIRGESIANIDFRAKK